MKKVVMLAGLMYVMIIVLMLIPMTVLTGCKSQYIVTVRCQWCGTYIVSNTEAGKNCIIRWDKHGRATGHWCNEICLQNWQQAIDKLK